MSVTEVAPIFRSLDADENDEGVRTYRLTYQVLTDSVNDGPIAVLAASGLPRIGDTFGFGNSSDFGAYCKRRTARQPDETGLKWQVEVEWASDSKPPTETPPENPLDELPKYSLGFVRETAPLEKDGSGSAIVNSAGVPFNPPIEVEVSRPVLKVQRNEPPDFITLAARAIEYQDAVNSDTFYGAVAGKARMMSIEVSTEFKRNGVSYCVVSYEIQFNTLGWSTQAISRGVVEKFDTVGGSYGWRLIRGSDGLPVKEPVLLDSSGAKASPTATPHVQTINVYPSKAFAALGL